MHNDKENLPMSDKICVIGAGSAGLTAVKALKEQGLDFDCFEMGSDVGGNWRYDNDNGRSSAYASLHIDTSKERMQFSDLPMSDEYPNFPHHSQVLEYFEQYTAVFGLRPHITFRTCVEHVAPHPQGGYEVTIKNVDSGQSETRHYRAVLVCNGHHWQERWPDFPGDFHGHTQHSHTYREPYPFKDKNVVVVGIGNSGVDLACDISHVAQQVYLSTRRSAYIIPRYIMGKPTDKWVTPQNSNYPFPLTRLIYKLLLRLAVGDQENYGVPKPEHELLSEHPTMSAELLNATSRGDIIVKANIRQLRGDQVEFEDGSVVAADAIVYATGYKIAFPFFDDDLLNVGANNEVRLYRRVVHPTLDGLFFIGLIQPLGAIMPLAEVQAKWVAGLLAGECALPDKQTMLVEIANDQEKIEQRYVKSARHTIQVDFYPYLKQLQNEIAAGQKRVRALA
jgi:dimethylaniline monooxygenase (N-oxide forming)